MCSDFKLTGVDVATAQLIADKLGVKAEFVPVSTPNRIPYLQAKKIDLIVSALGKNPEREKVIDFTVAYAPFFQAVFGPKALNIKSFDDLAGKSIAVTRGTIQDDVLQKVAPPTLKTQRFEDDSTTVAAFIPNFPLAPVGWMMGGEFDRQIELRGLIPKPLHPLSVLHGHCQIQYRLSTLGSRISRLGK